MKIYSHKEVLDRVLGKNSARRVEYEKEMDDFKRKIEMENKKRQNQSQEVDCEKTSFVFHCVPLAE